MSSPTWSAESATRRPTRALNHDGVLSLNRQPIHRTPAQPSGYSSGRKYNKELILAPSVGL